MPNSLQANVLWDFTKKPSVLNNHGSLHVGVYIFSETIKTHHPVNQSSTIRPYPM
ncbi:hypothetical protein DPMN_123234 [Dreissena polymorpha]|uniref:Uncharacterized protein n=1 Tax=Dreissena polymorpha TaxID=45954 RepID=A0A9D4GQX7_DREPO|nr:hypothetical protein DPMN_123234 [Dreissena polymorpha]